jgi:riboflavin kinase/FMN adenylyltransferase
MKKLPQTITGTVVRGLRKAGPLGYPTANLAFDTPPALEHGIYLGRCAISPEQKDLPSIIFYGTPYALGESLPPRFEVHILDQRWLELYNSTLSVRCDTYIRENKKFANPEELTRAIGDDIARAKSYFSMET